MSLHSRALCAAIVPLLLLGACANGSSAPDDSTPNTPTPGGPSPGEMAKPPKLSRPQRSPRPPVAVPVSAPLDGVFESTGLPDTQTGHEIFAYMVASYKPATQQVVAEMEAAMRLLDRHPSEVVAALVDAYGHLNEESYPARADIVYLLGRVRDVAALAALETIARSEMPPERYPPSVALEGGSQEREFSIRSAAIQGIAILDIENKDAISKSLRTLTGAAPDRGLRAVAARNYLQAGDFVQRSAELRNLLDPRDHWMLAR